MNESECAGRLIWFKATAGNERFHTYVFQQRVGVLIDWFRVLRSDEREQREGGEQSRAHRCSGATYLGG